ncbi:hypothetical protein [Salmonella enterica]|uniref:hypothetical protein n=1 Tax=Salmonella enterica TaxID=28901 RepID=UPI002350209E|nr:hypothetical protein [Salmonella enterica]MDC7964705.1 hypothetical protein [Salmonella enterica subsp. enterica serovar 4,[5],12:i:-]
MQKRVITFTLRVMQVTQCACWDAGYLSGLPDIVRRLIVIVEQSWFIELLQLVKQQLLSTC